MIILLYSQFYPSAVRLTLALNLRVHRVMGLTILANRFCARTAMVAPSRNRSSLSPLTLP